MKFYFLVGEFFKLKNNLANKKVTLDEFEKNQKKNIHMLGYTQ